MYKRHPYLFRAFLTITTVTSIELSGETLFVAPMTWVNTNVSCGNWWMKDVFIGAAIVRHALNNLTKQTNKIQIPLLLGLPVESPSFKMLFLLLRRCRFPATNRHLGYKAHALCVCGLQTKHK